ncbi:hypothetical protein UY3_10004 [Chelonia mydas]|uniref:Uncharacterized protein n=1 Tax=Chelonia mydas TaxID=8469 RepID=M7BXP8_CHEMY|nr:hypothetical protein UY3_10004 [Chelonia mydas]
MVGHELNSQVVLLKQHADQKTEKSKQQFQTAKQRAAELQAAKATVPTLTLQVAQLVQQMRDLSVKATAAERTAEIKMQGLLESQAAVRQLIKEAADNREKPASHVECQCHIKQSQDQLQLTQGLMKAVDTNSLAAFTMDWCGKEQQPSCGDHGYPIRKHGATSPGERRE